MFVEEGDLDSMEESVTGFKFFGCYDHVLNHSAFKNHPNGLMIESWNRENAVQFFSGSTQHFKSSVQPRKVVELVATNRSTLEGLFLGRCKHSLLQFEQDTQVLPLEKRQRVLRSVFIFCGGAASRARGGTSAKFSTDAQRRSKFREEFQLIAKVHRRFAMAITQFKRIVQTHNGMTDFFRARDGAKKW